MSAAVRAAGAAAQALGRLNRATARGGFEVPGDVDDVLAELELVVSRLPQALRQAGAWLDAECRAGRVREDGGEPVRSAVDDVLGDVERACREACSLVVTLASVRDTSAHLSAAPPAWRGLPVADVVVSCGRCELSFGPYQSRDEAALMASVHDDLHHRGRTCAELAPADAGPGVPR